MVKCVSYPFPEKHNFVSKFFSLVLIWFWRPSMNLWYFYRFSLIFLHYLSNVFERRLRFFYSSYYQSDFEHPELSIFGIISFVLSDREIRLSGIKLLYSLKYSLKLRFFKKKTIKNSLKIWWKYANILIPINSVNVKSTNMWPQLWKVLSVTEVRVPRV